MAFLGTLGKLFLGGATTGQVIGGLTGNAAFAKGVQDVANTISTVRRAARTEQGQSTGVSIPDQPASETSTSGSSDMQNLIFNLGNRTDGGIVPAAFQKPPMGTGMGNFQQAGLPAIIGGGVQAGRGMLGAFLGGAAAGVMAPTIIDPITGQEKKLRVTRRLRSQVKKAVEFFGVEAVAEQMGVSVEVIFFILTKRIRNDGPAITKAALRKTRSTLRKLDAMCDMRDKMRPPARRAPRARTTSKVMQIKN